MKLYSLILAVAATVMFSWVQAEPGAPMAQNAPHPSASMLSLNFVDADIEGVIKAVGEAIGKNILVDPKVKGTMTLTSDKPLSKTEALATLTAALRLQGYALVEGPGFYRVVPEADAKLQGGRVTVDASGAGGATESAPVGDQVITQVFRLKYESANNLVAVLRPLIAANNSITAYPGNNTLVISDYSENVRRIARIIAAIDTPHLGDMEVIPLRNGLALDIAAILNKLNEGTNATTDQALRTVVIPEPRTNSILLRAVTASRSEQMKTLIQKLDNPTTQPGNIWVVPLKNAEASKLAQTLRGIVSGESGSLNSQETRSLNTGSMLSTATSSSSAGSSNQSANNSNQAAAAAIAANANPLAGNNNNNSGISGGGMIQADPTTNSIIITANERVYRNLRAVIDRLDARRPQIYVESMIVEVSDGKTQELGVQLQGLIGGGSTQTFAGTSFQNSVPGSNIVTLGTSSSSLLTLGANANGNTVLPSGGTNIGVFRNFNGVMGLAGLARAVSNISGVNVLSAPNLLTLDNEAATIVIADNIPVVTGQYAATAGTSAISPFTTVDRKDVGLTLKIKPQISEGGLVRLQIYEESSTVDANTATNAYGPSYTKRSLETNVLVDDGQLIVLGGLLSDSYNDSVQKTPFLGDIPWLGALFRYETKARTKDNLMLFLRPYVVRTAEQSDALTNDRYNRMNGIRENLEPNVKYLGNEDLTTMPAAKGSGMPLVDPARGDTGATAKPLPGGAH